MNGRKPKKNGQTGQWVSAGIRPVSSCTRSKNSGQYIAVFVQLCLGAQFTCYLIMGENICRAARWLVTIHEMSCKFLTQTSRMHAGSCDLVTLAEKWLHQDAGSANQCELLHFCTITQFSWPRVMWGQVYKSGSIQIQVILTILYL